MLDGLSRYPYLSTERILDTMKVFRGYIDTTDGVQATDLICGFERAAFDTKPDDKYQAFTNQLSRMRRQIRFYQDSLIKLLLL